jgi:hypothetical protein
MLDPYYKKILGFNPEDDDKTVLKLWKKNVQIACKPCLELKYCPYGSLVEDFPAYPITRDEAESCVDDFDPEEYPATLPPKIISDCYCNIFGHICPVFFIKEPFTESDKPRRITRYIPTAIKLQVARRDGYQCQMCNKLLRVDEVQYDHQIPFSKGGPSDTHNLQVICSQCNCKKSNKVI